MKTSVYLVRHGETDWNRDWRWQGHSDRLLTERGREQARKLARELAGTRIDAVYASDLLRAAETAEIIAGELGLPVKLDPRLREINVGSWEGMTGEEILLRWPEAHARWELTGEPGWEDGETHAELARRVYEAVDSIAAEHPGGTVLVVCHGGPVKAVLMRAMGLDYVTQRDERPPIQNCQVCRIAVEDGIFRPID